MFIDRNIIIFIQEIFWILYDVDVIDSNFICMEI